MAGFPLGGGAHHHHHHHHQTRDIRDQEDPIQPESLFLYGSRAAAAAAGGGSGGGFQIWQHQQQQQLFSGSGILSFSDEAGAGGGSMRGGAGAGGGGISCQDCGNQAKKDCAHLRCRTCCKSRGFHCSTHVKSTWVPAAKRRERQQQVATLSGGGGGESSKRPREVVRSLAAPITTTTTTPSSGRFPSEVSSEAVFRCVRLGPVDEGESEYAYQTSVSIAGHVFRGILHDHGPDSSPSDYQTPPVAAPETLTRGGGGGGGGEMGGDIVMTSSSAAALMDPYPTPICDFMAGAGHFFSHHPRS